MVGDILTLAVLALATGVAFGEVCSAGTYYFNYKYSIYCEDGCCGYYYDRSCCPSLVGLIVGAVIGGLCFIGGIVFLICLCHHCNKKKTAVAGVITNHPTGTTVVSSNQQGVYYQSGGYQQPGAYQQPGTYPPPPGPYQTQAAPGAYPPPPAGYQPPPPAAYPPPAPGQSNPSALDQGLPEKH